MERLNLWWRDRTAREQRLLSIMFALLVLVFGWLLVAQPLIRALDEVKLRHDQAVIALAEARARAETRQRPEPRRMAPAALPLDALVSRTAAEAGFTGVRIAGQGPNRVSATIDAARPMAYFGWIQGLERQGLVVETLRAQTNPDRTLTTEVPFARRSRVMRFSPTVGRSAFFLAIFILALIALIPLRLAIGWFGLDRFGIAAREASGSIWLGALKEAQIGPAPLGTVEVRLNRLPLLIGRHRLSLERQELDSPLRGAATLSGRRFSLDDFTGQLRLGAALAPLPVAALDLDDVSVAFAGELCESAEGRIRAISSARTDRPCLRLRTGRQRTLRGRSSFVAAGQPGRHGEAGSSDPG
jgi:general secretion pathway protein M